MTILPVLLLEKNVHYNGVRFERSSERKIIFEYFSSVFSWNETKCKKKHGNP